MTGPSAKRRYSSELREASARRTRSRILQAAHGLLESAGYSGLSVAALAKAAEVSPQTIYNSIGGKAEVLKACYDVALAGDDEPVAMAERPEVRALLEASSAEEFLHRYAHMSLVINARVATILGAVYTPGVGDEGTRSFTETIERERRIGTTRAITQLHDAFGLPESVGLEAAIDITWTLNSPEVYDRLVRRCGWSGEAYQQWLTKQLLAALC